MTQGHVVRYSYLTQQFSVCKDLWQKLKKFLKTAGFNLGEELKKFENSFAKLISSKSTVGVNSGTDAIKLSRKTLGLGQGVGVITAANAFVAAVGSTNEFMKQDEFIYISDETNNFLETNLILNRKHVDFVSQKFNLHEIDVCEECSQIKVCLVKL
jgi:dTDP-4-amino-4,6-dideoxygalactose transaminase